MYAKYTGFFRTLKETSTGSPRDTCTRGAVDYRFISVLTKTLKHPKWVLFYRKTCRETSTGTPRDTCTRGAVDHQILDVSCNIYKSKHLERGAFFVSFSPFREPLLPNGSDIAYAVILSSTVILRCSDICPAGKLWINTATSAGSRNIILTTAKI